MAPWIFLSVALFGALLTFNAYVPQRRTGLATIPSFFAGWLVSELPLHHIGWQAVATVLFVLGGALTAWPGWLGLGITLVSWAGLVGLLRLSQQARHVFEASLVAAYGPDYRERIEPELNGKLERTPGPPARPLWPFKLLRKGITVHRDIPYVEGGGQRHQLDIYVPEGGVRQAPVLLQIHGGAWIIGNKHEQAIPLMSHLAAQGWVCVATNYRLSPKATWPDHLVDVKRALAWIREHIAEYGGDPNFVVATGGSAGGHLTAMVGLTANDPDYQPGFESADTSVAAAVPFYGVYDLSDQYRLNAQEGMDDFVAERVLKVDPVSEVEAMRRASPLHRIHPDAPPFFIIHGSADSLVSVEAARHFAWALRRESRDDVVYSELSGTQHAFEVFHSERTTAAVQAVDRFLAVQLSAYRAKQRDHQPQSPMADGEAPAAAAS